MHKTCQMNFWKVQLLEVCNFEKDQLDLCTGKKLDKKYLIVNLADQMAHYLFKNYPCKVNNIEDHYRSLII